MRSIWRALLLLAVCCGISARLEAQGGFTTVTGTITDPNGLKYSCGTITAQLITAGGAAPTLNGGGFTTQTSPIGLGCPTTPGTGAPGSFLMRLADSGVIVPSTTTWRFTINLAPGIPPPAGTGPQSFSVTTAINCGTNTPATCTSNAMDISAFLSASAPAISSGSAGGSSSPQFVPYNLNTDVFNRVTLGANWTTYLNGVTVTTGIVAGTASGATNLNVIAYNAASPTPITSQTSSAQVMTVSAQGAGPAINISGTPTTSVSYYVCVETLTALSIQKVVGASNAALGTVTVTGPNTITGLPGDTIRISRVGNTITCQRNGSNGSSTNMLEFVDTSSPLTGGLPGLSLYENTNTVANFSFVNPQAPAGTTKYIVADGDSITAANGQGSANTDPYTNYLQIGQVVGASITNLGVNSKCVVSTSCTALTSGTIETSIATGTSIVDTLCVTGAKNIVILMIGTNDVAFGGQTAAQTYTGITTYITNRHAAAGCNWKVAIVPQVSRGNGSATDQAIQSLNQMIYTNSAGADVVVQLTPNVTANQASGNTYIFNSDNIHPTSFTQFDILAKAISVAVSTL